MAESPTSSTAHPGEPEPGGNPFSEGIRGRRRVDPCAIVLLGATGDLTHRKLAPALYNLARDGHLPQNVAILGFARRPMGEEEFRRSLARAVRRHARDYAPEDALLERFTASIFYHRSSFDDPEGFVRLRHRLSEIDRRSGTAGNRLFYLATSPEWFSRIVRLLGHHGLAGPRSAAAETGTPRAPWSRVVVEKPFGHSLASAAELNRELLEVLDESQIYRIDHYLGKETVQNILAFRFSNGIFEPLWNQKYVDHVQITVAESLGIGGRGPYYDGAGAVRDMVQNHMLQLLALVAMEPPVSMDPDAVRDEKVKALRALRPMDAEDVRRCAVRGQYREGSILGEAVKAYRSEDRVPENSATPTYAALRAHIDNWRWSGVPFFLRHGKRLPKRVTEIAIQFRTPPMKLFGSPSTADATPNALILNIQPDEGISLRFESKVPGPDVRLRSVKMDFRYGRSFGVSTPDAYERLLLDAIGGDSTLFTRRDEVEASWSFVEGLLREWEEAGDQDLCFYPAGSWGPEAAERLFEGTSGRWRRL